MCKRSFLLIFLTLLLLTLAGSTSAALVGHYKLDGDASDETGDNPGTEAGNPAYVAGMFDRAISLDGSGDYVSIANESNFDISESITVALWMKITAFDKPWQGIITKGDSSWRFGRQSGTNEIAWCCQGLSNGDVVIGGAGLDDDRWHHIAGVYEYGPDEANPGELRLYIDGVESNSHPAWGNISLNNFPVYIGENAQATGREFNGLIDDVRIYSRALSGSEIAGLLTDNNCDSGVVDFIDFSELAEDWLREAPSLNGDLNYDGIVDIEDMAIMAEYWLIPLWTQIQGTISEDNIQTRSIV